MGFRTELDFSMNKELRDLERLEEEQRVLHNRSEQEKKDQYNSLDPAYNYTDYHRIINTSLEFAPQEGQTWVQYYEEMKIHAKIAAKLNRNSHIFGKHGHWHTHVIPGGCFMCSDNIMISMLVKTIGFMANQYPQAIF